MISGTVLILFAKAFNKFSSFLNIVRDHSAAGQQQKCLFMSRLLVENLPSSIPRLRILTNRQNSQTKFELHFHIVRLQFSGLLQQQISLKQLALVVIDDAQLA